MGNAKDLVLAVLFERREMLSEDVIKPENANRPDGVLAAENLELPSSR